MVKATSAPGETQRVWFATGLQRGGCVVTTIQGGLNGEITSVFLRGEATGHFAFRLKSLQQPQLHTQQSTTSFLTATPLVYTAAAGITAAAGTRLALQLILAAAFGWHPSQNLAGVDPNQVAILRRCLAWV